MGWSLALRSATRLGAAILAVGIFTRGASAAEPPTHNVIIFVADGLRYGAVDALIAPQMQEVRSEGVDFADSHALFPTLTTPNASAIATGHGLGDTGDFANTVYVGQPALKPAFLSLTPFLEDDAILGAMNARFGGDYLGETSLLAAARTTGFQTAAIGKLGPAAIQDVTARDGCATLLVDDASGTPDGLPLCPDLLPELKRAGLDPVAPDRGLNTDPGNAIAPGVQVANVEQQDWFTRVASEVVLPRFAAAKRPFVLVFWSRDPDGTQHNEGDSLNVLSPGINGATSLAAIRNADNDLAALRAALRRLGLEATTDIVVTADHGFATISRASATSPAAKVDYPDVPHGFLPPGFLALDLGRALGLPVHEPTGLDLAPVNHPKHASAVLGADPLHPEVVIGANGGERRPLAAGGLARAADPSSAKDRRGPQRAGLYQRDLHSRRAGAGPRRPADERHRPEGRGPDAGAGPDRQLPQRRGPWLRPRPRALRLRGGGHRAAAGSGHPRRLRPGDHPQHDGRGRSRLPQPLPRPRAGRQRGLGAHPGAHPAPADRRPRRARRPGDERGAMRGSRCARRDAPEAELHARGQRLRHHPAGARWRRVTSTGMWLAPRGGP